MVMRRQSMWLAAAANAFLLACGGAQGLSRSGSVSAQSLTVSVSPATPSIVAGGSLSFTATVTGASDTAVDWSVREGADGGRITEGGVYTAPSTSGTYHVVATSVADPTAFSVSPVVVTATGGAPAVTVSPPAASVATGGTVAFTAAVANAAAQTVTWSVQPTGTGGTVTAGGLYTAPSTAGTYQVVATSTLDPSKSGSAAVTVTAAGVRSFGGSMKLGTNFWDLGWGIWNDVFASGVQLTNIASYPNPWNPAFLSEVKNYQVLRFMDWDETNTNTDVNWSQRVPRTGTAGVYRIAWEWMIDLCNRTNADMWINVPTYANDDYALQLATLINSSLNSNLRVFVEWSNEAWNFAAANAEECSIGQQIVPGDSQACAEGYVARAVQIFHQFETVFGANNPRLVKVIAGQAVNSYLTSVHLAALKNSVINPNNVSATAYAIAPYFGYTVDGSSSNAVSELDSGISSGANDPLDAAKSQAQAVAGSGLVLIAYEGGQSVTTNASDVQGNSGMYQMYTDYLNAMAPYFALFVHYVHNGPWSSTAGWGAEQHVGDPLTSSPKLHAILDFAAAHP